MPELWLTPGWWSALRRLGLALAIAASLFVVAVIGTARWGDRSMWPAAPGAPVTEVFVVNHGYHAGIIVPRKALAELGSRRGLRALAYVATRFADYDRLEIGWGDEGFYREVPTAKSLTVALAVRPYATRQPVRSARGGRQGRPARHVSRFPIWSGLISARPGSSAWRKSSTRPSPAGPMVPAGGTRARALWGEPFFRANGAFHLFNVCNHSIPRPARCRGGANRAGACDIAVRPAARSRMAIQPCSIAAISRVGALNGAREFASSVVIAGTS